MGFPLSWVIGEWWGENWHATGEKRGPEPQDGIPVVGEMQQHRATDPEPVQGLEELAPLEGLFVEAGVGNVFWGVRIS